MSCAVFTIVGVFVLAFNKSNTWALRATFGAAIILLFVATFLAWREQYRENEVGRAVGSVALVDVGAEFNRHGELANPQAYITFKNLQSRLIEYTVENLQFTLENKPMEPIYTNKGGYIYAGATSIFRANTIRDVPLKNEPLTGKLEYNISYRVFGSKEVHHSKKVVTLDLFYSKSLMGKYAVLEEHED